MPFHDSLPFNTLHKSRLDGGEDVALPPVPEGFGDVYWAADGGTDGNGALYLTNADGDAWIQFSSGGGGGGATTLNDLTDVDVIAAQNGQVLTYNSATGLWQASAIPRNFSQLLDVNVTGVADGRTIAYDIISGQWIPAIKVSALGDLVDVAQFTQAKGDIMASNGSLFNRLPVGNDDLALVVDSNETLGMKWAIHFPANLILTADGEVLVDADGNVMTEDY